MIVFSTNLDVLLVITSTCASNIHDFCKRDLIYFCWLRPHFVRHVDMQTDQEIMAMRVPSNVIWGYCVIQSCISNDQRVRVM